MQAEFSTTELQARACGEFWALDQSYWHLLVAGPWVQILLTAHIAAETVRRRRFHLHTGRQAQL